MNKNFITTAIAAILLLVTATCFGQNPVISYSPSSYVLTQNSPTSPIIPNNSGGAVSSFSYGTGTSITGGSLDHPYGVVTDASGNVYVANYGVDKKDPGSISKYNVTTHTWSTFTTDSINNPSAIVFDKSGNLYVLNYQRTNNGNGNTNGNAYVTEYNSSGTLIGTVVQGLGPATGIAINNSSGNLDVAEEGANGGNAVVAEYTTGGALNFTLSNTAAPNPVNVASDNAGNIYVLDNSYKDVVKFSSTGTYISTPVTSGLSNPFGLYVDGSGNIYVSDSGTGSGTNCIKVYNSSGTLLTNLSGMVDPEGMTTDSKGNLYVTDIANNWLTEYKPTGGYYISGKLPPGLTFDYSTGTISGTPLTTFSATTYTVTAYNGSSSSSTTITLSCTGNSLAPTIVYNPSVQVITIGTLDTLKATTTNSPNSFSSSPALPTGVSFSASGNILVNNVSTVSAATVYTITATNTSTGLSATTTISLAFVVDNYWTGNHNSDWNTKQNWSANSVPTSTTLASVGVINYTGPDPIVSATSTVGYLTLGAANTAKITVSGAGVSLTINNILQVNTNATPTFAGTGTFNVISTGIVSVIGTGNLTVSSGTSFVLQSTASGSASVDAMTSGSISGQVSVQRYLTAQRNYRLLASPINYSGTTDANGNLTYSLNYVINSAYVTGTTGTTGGFDKTGNPTLYLYREDVTVNNSGFITGNYRGVSNLNSAPVYSLNNEASAYSIPAGNGYLFFFRGNRASGTVTQETQTSFAATTATLTTTGYLNHGQFIFRDWYTPSSTVPGFSNASAAIKGFNLAGNPYACTIDLDTYNTVTTTSGIYGSNVSPFFYELNPKSMNYDTYEAGTGGVIYTNAGSRYIASGQGFFFRATAAGGELIFNESAKTVSTIPTANLMMSLRSPLLDEVPQVAAPQLLRLQMALDTANTDDMLVVFDDNASPGFMPMEDALYRTGAGKVSLCSISDDNQLLAINKLPLRNGVTIPLKAASNAYNTYTLKLTEIKGIPQLFDIWLKDAFTGDSVNMRQTTSYTFAITSDTNTYRLKRFSITLRVNPGMSYKLLSFNGQVWGKQAVQLTWTTQNEADNTNFTVERTNDGGKTYSVIGTLASTGQGSYGLIDSHALIGDNIYVLRSANYNNTVSVSNPVDIVFQDNTTSNVSCYPNPAADNINVTIIPISQGSATYEITVTNARGVVVKQATVSGTHWQGNISSLLTGSYIIEVVDQKDNSLMGRSKFVKL